MRSRSWLWLRQRIQALTETPPVPAYNGRRFFTFPATRIGWVLNPPNDDVEED